MDARTPVSPSSRSSESWAAELATATLTGILTARFPLQRWSRSAQWTVHGGMGAAAAAALGYALSRPAAADTDDGEEPSPGSPGPALTAGLSVLLGLTVAAASRGGQAADVWAERQLRSRGVRRPRMWLGLAAAGASLAMGAADRRREDSRAQTAPGSVGGGGVPGAGG